MIVVLGTLPIDHLRFAGAKARRWFGRPWYHRRVLALLIGAPTQGLAGVDHDLAGMAALVRARGGEPVVLPRATLPAIRGALAALVDRCPADVPVLLYLTGHGGALVNTEHDSRAPSPAPARLSYFITTDEDRLFDLELSLWCARLAGKTRNVTAILDCCHSATLVRGDDRDDLRDRRLAAFFAWRAAHQREIDALDAEAHPDVVRLAAAGINGRGRIHDQRSALTSALLAELTTGEAPSWVALFAGIERWLARAGVPQQPRLSGPVRRRVFSLAEALPPGAVPVRRAEGRIILAAGQQHGVRRGDLFLVDIFPDRVCHVDDLAPTHAVLRPRGGDMSSGTPPAALCPPGDDLSLATGHPDTAISLGTDRSSSQRALLSPETGLPTAIPTPLGPAQSAPPDVDMSHGTAPSVPRDDLSLGPDAYALPLHLRGHGGVVVTGPPEPAAALARALQHAGWDVHAGPGGPLLATLACSDAAIVVHAADAPACATLLADDLAGLLAVLQRLARSARLQHLGAGSLAALTIKASWGRVRAGICEPLSPRGAELADDAAVFVRLENAADDRRFVSVFWLADDGEAALLSRSESMGIELPPGTTHVLGARPFARTARGVVLPRRPLAPGERRHERLVIVATPHRQALWSFDSPRPAGTPHRGDGGASVEVFAFTVLTAATPS
ncbi:Caspase domain-containing protein [Nannocystis exedens]|uniref:Caspase domain-containing protein n=1 Tax=Nannocystis exedens TaxID=54 RepID=A0A1I1YUU6_9BACT|nr:hypothetical protein NAEX_03157 [Nannocystis exedens]SFE23249.1 Caspase domain-containing protein [Nannocystis exedens]